MYNPKMSTVIWGKSQIEVRTDSTLGILMPQGELPEHDGMHNSRREKPHNKWRKWQ